MRKPFKAAHWVIRTASRTKDIFRLAYLFATELQVGANDDTWLEIIIRPVKSKRTLDQNAKMWAMLADVARQKQWVVNGVLQYLEPSDWKDIFSAAARFEARIAQGLNGGIVLLGRSTSRLTVKEMGELIEVMHCFAAENGIRWSMPKSHLPEHWEVAA